MTNMPYSLGTFHFVGIGGIGMSGIAEVLHNLGYQVQGSDLADSANVQRLRAKGITIHIGHQADNITGASVLVISSAVKDQNPEVIAARQKLIPVVRRAEMLAELMRLKWSISIAGTHGKTTTTSMIASLIDAANLDPTVINGGIINAYGSNMRMGSGDWMVVEADESDGTFIKLPSTVAVVTNIDPEHMDHYGSYDNLKAAFDTFVQNLPFYGFAALCIDHPEVQAMIPRVSERKILSYGFNHQADIQIINWRSDLSGSYFDILFSDRTKGGERTLSDCFLPMHGKHNVQNACAAICVATELGLSDVKAREAIGNFEGVKRRFTKTGEVHGITIIDDYAHHPVEISSVLKAARQACAQNVIAVVQPHRYTRLRDLFEEFCGCFNDADTVIVANVHAAGEAPIDGVDRDALAEGLRLRGHKNVLTLNTEADLANLLEQEARTGDLVICLGAGSITHWANALPAQMMKLKGAA